MHTDEFEHAIKVVVVGNGSVGKSSLIRRFCKNQYVENYKKTIGVEYQEKELHLPTLKETVRLMVWDCAGQEEFDQMTRQYYSEADAVILAFAATDRASFDMIRGWKAKLETVLKLHNIPAVLVQNKIDLKDQLVVEPREAEALARELQLRLYGLSVKDNTNVEEVFIYLAESYLKRKRAALQQQQQPQITTKNPTMNLFIKDPAAIAQSKSGPSTDKEPATSTAPTTQRRNSAGSSNNKKDPCLIM